MDFKKSMARIKTLDSNLPLARRCEMDFSLLLARNKNKRNFKRLNLPVQRRSPAKHSAK